MRFYEDGVGHSVTGLDAATPPEPQVEDEVVDVEMVVNETINGPSPGEGHGIAEGELSEDEDWDQQSLGKDGSDDEQDFDPEWDLV